ncbi:hypothetical protein [Aminobacter carboxidus]|jgi:hypothetical protein|uniref:N,N-dimethylformamidase alpha subunit domain-containing protein n=1 Tax=Aminobacter carboxidus TaxID=376165 RepID=A0ABR9GQZ5_9HYPH|nr:hypothetical protein [Aminobacter carboxidus]MBE1206058.1 hypothetical protein [Aminobacter carboxidus]
MYKPSAAERDVALQFRDAPGPTYSMELQRMLDYFRSAMPIEGRYVLACTIPNREWKVCRLTGVRGRATVILDNMRFDNQREAEWEVFKLRWKQVVGTELEA